MTTSTTINSSSAVVTTISQDEADTLTSALEVLFGVVKSQGADLGRFDSEDCEQAEKVCVRTLKALINLQAAKKEEKVRMFRAGVQKGCDTYMELAQAEKQEFDDMSVALRNRLGLTSFPNTVAIPLGALVACFPSGTAQESMIKILHDMGQKVSKDKEGAFTMRIAFVAA